MTTVKSQQVVATKDVIGKSVINQEKENLGKIEEIVLDKLSGEVRYAVLSFGGFLGMGSDFYALPWKTLDYCKDEEAFIINVDKEKLKSASGFNKDQWPEFSDEKWGRSIYDFYDTKY